MTTTKEYARAAYLRYKESLRHNPEKLARHRELKNAGNRKRGAQPRSKEAIERRNFLTIDKMADCYIAMCIRNSTGATGEIPKPLIEIWRKALTLKRIVKQQTKKETSND